MRKYCTALVLLITASSVYGDVEKPFFSTSPGIMSFPQTHNGLFSSHEALLLGKDDTDNRTRRMTGKIIAGVLVGGLATVVGGAIGAGLEDCDRSEFLCGLGGALIGGSLGLTVGTAVGVTAIDPHDRFINAMLGSLAGFGAGIAMTASHNKLWPSLFVLPAVASALMSEASRDPYRTRRFSIGLMPKPNGKILAVARIRF